MKIALDALGVTTGGNKTILKNLINFFINKKDIEKLVILIEPFLKEELEYFINNFDKMNKTELIVINNKSYLKRLLYVNFLMHNELKLKKVETVISLTNIGTFINSKINHFVYFHQALIFVDLKEQLEILGLNYTLRFRILKFLVALTIKKANCYIVQTDTIKKNFIKHFGKKISNKVYRIYPGRPFLDVGKCKNKKFYKINKFSLIYMSHPAEYKNYEVLIETAKLAKQKNINNFVFLLTLDRNSNDKRYSSFVNYYMSLIKKYELNEYFYFLGRLNNLREIYCGYNISDALIHSSLYESFPMPFIEYMDFRKPIVAIEKEYAKEILDSSGLFFKDEYDLLEVIQKLINNHDFYKIKSKEVYERRKIFNRNQWEELYNLIKKVNNA